MGICDTASKEGKNKTDGQKENPKQVTNKSGKNEIIGEIFAGGAKKIPMKNIDEAKKSICKILFGKRNATGFFVVTPFNGTKSLITNYHVINRDIINEYISITLELHDKKIYKLNLANFYNNIKFYEKLDITVIQINTLEDLCQNVSFLEVDMNYINGYNNYLEKDIFTLGFPNGEDMVFSPGKIIQIIENEFYHNCDTENGYSGSPIILSSDKRVIGIHRGGVPSKNTNIGTFIGTILENERNYNIINNNYEALIPRSKKNPYSKHENENNSNILNIRFIEPTGLTTNIIISGNETIRTLFQKYMDRLKLPDKYLLNELIFLYNGNSIDPFSNELICNKFPNGISIKVVYKNNLTGAIR